jgi:DNA-damage-inducible protein D
MNKASGHSGYGVFEGIRLHDDNGNEYWLARSLANVLEYSEYRHFLPVVEKAKQACLSSGHAIENHFEDILEMVPIGSGAKRQLANIRLSRYACYLIVQNGDPSKVVVAHGQTYFAIQTRRKELEDQSRAMEQLENGKRLSIRAELAKHNKMLAVAAKSAGVSTRVDYAIFQEHGYRGLYGGIGNKELHAMKGLSANQKVLDHMGSTELAANLFRSTQTEEKLRRDKVVGKVQANKVHFEVGLKVRQTIAEIGGTMPEDLPTPTKSIQQLKKQSRGSIDPNEQASQDQLPDDVEH